MLDKYARKLIDPPLNRFGKYLSNLGIHANTITLVGFLLGVFAAISIILHAWIFAFILIAISRVFDGLDGGVARASQKTDLGGYLDIVLDFFFYGMIPLAFVIAYPEQNAVAGAFLLFSFYASGTAFLAFAITAEKRGLKTDAQGSKSLYYLGGIAEGTETILILCLMCLIPQWFSFIAIGFGAICIVSTIARVISVVLILKTVPLPTANPNEPKQT